MMRLPLRSCIEVQDRAASLEHCPWCSSRGLTFALRSYRINLQESIVLCTNPQCLFPLVSRPLEDVLAGLAPVAPAVGSKRRSTLPPEREEPTEPTAKCLKANSGDRIVLQRSEPEGAAEAEGEKLNGHHRDADLQTEETAAQECLQDEVVATEMEPEESACSDAVASLTRLASSGDLHSSPEAWLIPEGEAPVQPEGPPEGSGGPCRQDSNQQCRTNGNVYPDKSDPLSPRHTKTEQEVRTVDIDAHPTMELEVEPGVKSSTMEPEQLLSVPPQLFWRNSDSLCWLDSVLVALVNCRSLRKSKPAVEPQRSSVWRLITTYDAICAAVQAHQQTGADGAARAPAHVLQEASADFQRLRMAVFKELQPKLQCKLGERESPVFAMPLLLSIDSWAEPLFQLGFQWEFECSGCKRASKQRVTKALPTFTNVVPDWRPLHAVHLAPCNACQKQSQRRSMILETVPPVFALHFVEGLPDSDVGIYAFSFKGTRYSVTCLIQYDPQHQHFVTWTRKPDGSWLEFDDLKHPACPSHLKLPVPAQHIHMVFWEAEEDEGACSSSRTLAGSPPSKAEIDHSYTKNCDVADELSAGGPDRSLVASHDVTDIVCALTPEEDTDATPAVGVDTSIGSTTLLDTFEGLSANDIITLTLVELKSDAKELPAAGQQQTHSSSLTNEEESKASPAAPDSSSMAPQRPAAKQATPDLSDAESAEEVNDPTYVPDSGRRRGRGRGRGRGKTADRQKEKKEPVVKRIARTPKPAPAKVATVTKVAKVTKVLSAQPGKPALPTPPTPPMLPTPPPEETSEQTSPVSYTNSSPPSASSDHHNRWSYLLSRHPLSQSNKALGPLSSTPTPVRPAAPNHSTPNPLRRALPTLAPKPQVRRESLQSLPIKAAEMFCAFGEKTNSPAPPHTQPQAQPQAQPLRQAQPQCQPQPQPLAPQFTSLCQTQVASNKPFVTPGLPDVCSPRKHEDLSSKAPPLDGVDALRYKLLKKLKAKKKKLAKLNQLLGQQGGAGGASTLRPDSTALSSPNTVTSSTFDGSAHNQFLSDLLSPATTASNLSPDSTDFLEMLTSRQDNVNNSDYTGAYPAAAAPQATATNTDDFLEELLSQAGTQQQTQMEAEALSALEMFF
ncbi:SUMO-specific isopeptidase USPL1 isoform X2 [Genypterus blacodes]|uniref:SUMO-specific isopeptidase USPL1 isoform X2 n=1 Tax=Genypterus blacodes TaxID=154954 RepID=UPI003F75A5AE